MIKVYEKNIPSNGIECLKLLVFPPNKEIQKSFEKLYKFDEDCKYRLSVEKKSGITCNSTHNYQSNTSRGFPSSYFKMQLNTGSNIIYTYYIDLKEDVKESDIQSAFRRLKKDVLR